MPDSFAAPLPPARLLPRAGSPPAGRRGAVPALFARLGVLLGAIAAAFIAAPGDFGALASDAARGGAQGAAPKPPPERMPFERAELNFPGSAFYYLADPPIEALVALPSADPLGAGLSASGRDVGALIDPGPAARPFLAAGLGSDHARAQRCLAEAIWYEAASESEAGRRAVAQVVLNRVAHPAWPASVCGVVYQGSQRRTGCQFTFTCDGSLARRPSGPGWQAAQRIAGAALAGAVYAPIGHATHYHTLWVDPYWARTLDHVGTIGAHHFYRNRGRAGERAAFSARYAGAEPLVSGRAAERAAASADPARPEAFAAGFAAGPNRPAASPAAPAGSDAPIQPTGAARTAPPLADPALLDAGRARAKYANAGRWKRDPAQASGAPAGSAPETAAPPPSR